MIGSDFRNQIDFRLAPDRIAAITRIESALRVADATAKYCLRTERETELVLIVSAAVSPLLVKRATDRQKEIRALLPQSVAEPIELPILEGYSENKSYAVFLKRRSFSTNKVRRKIERVLVAPRVYRWIGQLAVHTAKPSDASIIVANLDRLQTIPGLSEETRRAAAGGCAEFRLAKIPSLQVAQHGDLWTGNILRASSRTGFTIIDWAGGRPDGAPFFDLVTFGLSIRTFRSRLAREIIKYSHLVGCAPQHALSYWLGGLGALYKELEFFPEDHFIKMCDQTCSTLRTLFDA